MRPVVGSVSPARQLKKVDLPAPFGPIRPMISPSSIVRSAPATARRLPKVFETFSRAKQHRSPPEFRRDAVPHLVQPARLEARDHHDDAAIEDVGEAGAAAAEPGVGGGLQRDQDDGADQRAVQRAGAAERRDDHHLHRDQDAEPALRIDEAGLDRVERARDRREGRAQHQRIELGAPHRHAERARGALARLDGAQIVAEARALDRPGDEQQDHEHAEEDVVVRKLAAERQVVPAASDRRALQADRGADEIPGADHEADQLGDRDGRHAEIVALQAEGRHADDDREHEAHHDADRHADQRRQLPLVIDQQRQIGADAEEHAVADRDLPRIAADDVPGRGRDRGEQQRDADVEIEGVGEDERVRQKDRKASAMAPFMRLMPCPAGPAAGTTAARRTARRPRCPCRSGRGRRPRAPGSAR